MTDFDGLRAVVTGGASGIGLATANLLAGRGARVAVLALNPDVPAPLSGYRCDVSDDAEVRAAVGKAAGDLGGIDVLVNNAGIGAQGDVTANDDAERHRVLDVNVVGMARATRAAPRPWSTRARSPRGRACPTARCTPPARARSTP